MILYETYLAPSAIDGIGMFTKQFIPKGAVVWEFNEVFDRKFSSDTKESFPKHIQAYIERHGFQDKSGWWVIDGGHDQFVNHSSTPNLEEDGNADGISMKLIATRDILADSELTENYMEWDKMVALKKIHKTNPHIIAFESFVKMLNDNGTKAEITRNEVIDGIHYAKYTICPKIPIENITIDYEVIDGKITFKE